MTEVIHASGLGRAYGRQWALRDCTISLPEGRVVGLVGPNGAGRPRCYMNASGKKGGWTHADGDLGSP
jgi:ABC-2 type transport system ATP-binding protein